MSIPNWFDADYYFSKKLEAVKAQDGSYTSERLSAEFAAAGFSGGEGLFNHFSHYGHNEELAPNKFFDAAAYYTAKAAQYYNVQSVSTEQFQNIQTMIKGAGLSAWTHYDAYGWQEGLNASNSFDGAKYLDAKLAQMQETDPGATMESLKKAFVDAHLSPLEHYLMYGRNEGVISNEGDLTASNPVTPPSSITPPVNPDPDPDPDPTPEPGGETITISSNHDGRVDAIFAEGTYQGTVVPDGIVVAANGLYLGNVKHVALTLGTNTVLFKDEGSSETAISGNDLESLTITGGASSGFTTQGGIAVSTIDASEMQGSMRIELSSDFATTYSGGSGYDSVTSYGQADVMSGGGGLDTFKFMKGVTGQFTESVLHNQVATITDLSHNDTVNYSAITSTGSMFVRDTLTATSESQLISLINSHLSGTQNTAQAVEYDGDTYVSINSGSNASAEDFVVCLSGVFEDDFFFSGSVFKLSS